MNKKDKDSSYNGITISDVARLAGVSTATISRVINKTAYVKPETLAKVEAAIEQLDYRPQAAAQRLASRTTHCIGLLTTDISGDFFACMLKGLESAAREAGYALLISSRGQYLHTQAAVLGEQNTDGLVVFVDGLSDEELLRFNQLDFPVVLVQRSSPAGLEIPYVTVENQSGARKLVDHLIEVHGYRRIAYLKGETAHEDSYLRETGYRESLAAHNIPFDPQLVAVGGFERLQAREATEKWLREAVAIDAIFAGDDESAIGVFEALAAANLRVPEDIAVVGFDDIQLAQYLRPSLTTVRIPIEQVGAAAVTLLLQVMQKNPVTSPLLLPTELVVRESCGCCL